MQSFGGDDKEQKNFISYEHLRHWFRAATTVIFIMCYFLDLFIDQSVYEESQIYKNICLLWNSYNPNLINSDECFYLTNSPNSKD